MMQLSTMVFIIDRTIINERDHISYSIRKHIDIDYGLPAIGNTNVGGTCSWNGTLLYIIYYHWCGFGLGTENVYTLLLL